MSLSNVEISSLQWRKARRSVNNGACVEAARVSGHILIRDSTDRNGPVVRYSARSWRVFVTDTKTGLFDLDHL
jgi:hypothetical protein